MVGLCQGYLDTKNVAEMVEIQHLVDGMDLDEGWCDRNLNHANPGVLAIVSGLIAGKASRINPPTDNIVTCSVPNEDAVKVRRIPGYQ